MTSGRMGLHIQGAYDKAEAYIRAVRPPVVKFLDDAPAHLVNLVNGYGGLTILRVYREDQDLDRFDDYLRDIERAVARAPGVRAIEVSHNEAHQAGDELARKALADIRGMKLAERLGKIGVIGCFSVGMPDLGEWYLYRPALEYAVDHGHLLALHEYGGGRLGMDAGVTGGGKDARGWYCLRYRRVLDWAHRTMVRMPKIVITEAGIDDLSPGIPEKTRGYKTAAHLHPPSVGDYASQAYRYARHLAEDAGRVVGWVDFGFGAADPQWGGFNLATDDAMLARMAEVMRGLPEAAAPKPPKEATVQDLGKLLAAEFGERYSDLRSVLPSNPHGPAGDFSARPLAGIDTIAIHHTAGPKGQGWDAIAASHVNGRGWAGIGYHVGIKGGRVAYLGDASQARACCQNQNHRVLCVVLTGNYEADQVDAADAEALRRVVAVIQRWAGRQLAVKGHREVPGQQTACPGRNLLPLVHAIAAGGGQAPEPTPKGPNMAKVVWALEQSTRILEGEGLQAEAAFVAKQYTADAIRRRDQR